MAELLQLLLAVPIVWVACNLTEIEDDFRDIFNVALIAALSPIMLRLLLVLLIMIVKQGNPEGAHSLSLLIVLFPFPLQAVITVLAVKRLLISEWRQAMLVGAITTASFMMIHLSVFFYESFLDSKIIEPLRPDPSVQDLF